jgi:DNA mismatch endonuclease (patch repair protein)
MARRTKPARLLTLTERMQRIRKTDSQPELIVRRLVHGMGFRYRLHRSGLPGTPDIVLPRHRKTIFVHGCFWHRHDCPDGVKLPRSKPEYWGPKLERNRRRDAANVAKLQSMGWDVLVVWECELRSTQTLVRRLRQFLR